MLMNASGTTSGPALGVLPSAEPALAPPRRRLGARLRHIWPPALVLITLTVAWEVLTSALSVSSSILPGPALVLEATWADRANLWPAMWTTSQEAVLGSWLSGMVGPKWFVSGFVGRIFNPSGAKRTD